MGLPHSPSTGWAAATNKFRLLVYVFTAASCTLCAYYLLRWWRASRFSWSWCIDAHRHLYVLCTLISVVGLVWGLAHKDEEVVKAVAVFSILKESWNIVDKMRWPQACLKNPCCMHEFKQCTLVDICRVSCSHCFSYYCHRRAQCTCNCCVQAQAKAQNATAAIRPIQQQMGIFPLGQQSQQPQQQAAKQEEPLRSPSVSVHIKDESVLDGRTGVDSRASTHARSDYSPSQMESDEEAELLPKGISATAAAAAATAFTQLNVQPSFSPRSSTSPRTPSPATVAIDNLTAALNGDSMGQGDLLSSAPVTFSGERPATAPAAAPNNEIILVPTPFVATSMQLQPAASCAPPPSNKQYYFVAPNAAAAGQRLPHTLAFDHSSDMALDRNELHPVLYKEQPPPATLSSPLPPAAPWKCQYRAARTYNEWQLRWTAVPLVGTDMSDERYVEARALLDEFSKTRVPYDTRTGEARELEVTGTVRGVFSKPIDLPQLHDANSTYNTRFQLHELTLNDMSVHNHIITCVGSAMCMFAHVYGALYACACVYVFLYVCQSVWSSDRHSTSHAHSVRAHCHCC